MRVASKILATTAILAAVPALAAGQSAIPIPEPGDAGLFLMGAAGIVVGRWMHARRARSDGADRDRPRRDDE